MGFRFRKSKNIGPIRLNFSKSGVGYSIGGKGFRHTKMANGRTRNTYSIPGTGISYVDEKSSKNKKPKIQNVVNADSTKKEKNNKGDKKDMFKKIGIGFIILVILGACFGGSSNEIESIKISGDSQTLDINEKITYDTKLEPSEADDENIKIVVNDKSIITSKYKDGKVTIKSKDVEGKTTFYLKSDEIQSNKITITVVNKTKKAEEEAARKAQEEAEKRAQEEEARKEQEEAARKAEEQRQAQIQAQQTEQKVYIPQTGSKYHSNPNCSNMKNPSQVSLSEAQRRGYTPCKKCY